MALHAQKKGKRGEVELCEWIQQNLGITTEREYNQADGGSADIIIENFLIEVKRRESLNLYQWWSQVKNAHKQHEEFLIPVVAFRQNRKPWEFLIPAEFIKIDRGFLRVSETVFKLWAKKVISGEVLL